MNTLCWALHKNIDRTSACNILDTQAAEIGDINGTEKQREMQGTLQINSRMSSATPKWYTIRQ